MPEKAEQTVAVMLPLPLGGCYDYLVPPDLDLVPGDIVEAPLGKRTVNGVVWGAAEGGVAPEKLKSLLRRYDLPPLPEEELRFIDWVASYTLSAPGAVLRMALSVPQALEPPRPRSGYRALDGTPDEGLRLTPARRKVLEVAEGFARPASELAKEAGVGVGVVKGLAAAGALEEVALPPSTRFKPPKLSRDGVTLSGPQQTAVEALTGDIEKGGFSVTLLDGVTGSGKTEVYFEALAATLEGGRQALVLLPEIALSAQWLKRFKERFGVAPALWHSELSEKQRRETWRAIALGEARVVVGARSALFLPYPDLGLIVVDEEHESAFKQEDGVIYHARDMAVVRARLGEFPIILASATPALETLLNVKAGRYKSLELPERHGAASQPEIELIDLRENEPPKIEGPGGKKMPSWLSEPLRAALSQTLEAGEQSLLFLNRRGYAPLTLCRTCGHRMECPSCTSWLVEHRLAGRLQCHHCGYSARIPDRCPECGAEDHLVACGPGVERLAEEVYHLYPDARVQVMSSDNIHGPSAAEELIRAISDHEVDIVIGTQVIAKGHHFPMLTLVGVIDADLGLAGGDLRAAERTYQLLHQVAGRAGRAERSGKVLLQTYQPDHPVMRALAANDRDAFMAAEAEARERGRNPPFSRLAAIIVTAGTAGAADELAAQIAKTIPQDGGFEVLGPAPAPLTVLRGRHRRRFLVRARREVPLQALLKAWLSPLKPKGSARIQVDIDPYSFL